MIPGRQFASRVVDIGISACLVALLLFLIVKNPTETLPKDALAMLLTFYLGLLFACAYGMKDRLLLFRAISYACEHFSYPSRREMALVYSVVFFAVTAYLFIRGMNAAP